MPGAEGSRGDATRRRLIEAGLALFGKLGYNGVSTRSLARTAKVNLAAIPYHFGGKEGVYLAVVDHLAGTFAPPLQALVQEIDRDLALMRTRPEIEALLARFIGTMARIILGGEQRALRARFMMREQLQPTAAFDHLYARFIEPVHRGMARLVGRLLEIEPDDPATILRVHALFGQILAFAVAQATIRRRLGWRGDYTPEQIERIASIVVEMTLAAANTRPVPRRTAKSK